MARILILLVGCGVAYGDGPMPAVRATASRAAAAASSGPASSATASSATEPPSADIRDVLLLLDEVPLHLRFHVSLGGEALSSVRDAYVDRLMRSLDVDGDGKLTSAEAARSPLFPTKRRPGAAAFLDSGKPRIVQRADIRKQVDRAGGETMIYRQDASAALNDQEVFKFLDADGSGDIDRTEMSATAARILERDSDQDETISFAEFLPPPDPNAAMNLVRPGSAASGRATPTISDLIRDVSEPTLPDRLLKKYDKNRDNKLTPAELGWDPARLTALDANRDGKLDPRELARIGATPVDLELAVDLAGPAEAGQPAFTIISTTGRQGEKARRPDVVRLVFPTAVLTLSFRKVDSMKAAIDNAMRGFNQIDVDGNGYIDEKETELLVRFKEGGLFAALDADGDGKIFGEEMQKYVALRGEPDATAAWINVYDTGRGFFETLDVNGDGRISKREMQTAEKSLAAMKRRQNDRLTPGDPVRNFHLEFMRGSFQLFLSGPNDRMVAQTPTFEQRAAVGPIWFQRMDRNNDGDLTWNEFLGPREVFHRIDTDGDGLIDPQEAGQVADE